MLQHDKGHTSVDTLSLDPLCFTIVKRNGSYAPFQKERIAKALELAFRDTKNIDKALSLTLELQNTINTLTDQITEKVVELALQGHSITVEGIQDIVEIVLMNAHYRDVARDYIVYRDQHKALREDSPRQLKVLRRDQHSWARFNPIKITSSLERAFRRAMQLDGMTPEDLTQTIHFLCEKVVAECVAKAKQGEPLTVQFIENEIEKQLMIEGYYEVGKSLILYRSSQPQQKKSEIQDTAASLPSATEEVAHAGAKFTVTAKEGRTYFISELDLKKRFEFACQGLESLVDIDELVQNSISNFYEGIREDEVDISNTMAARAKIEMEPAYAQVTARLLLDQIYRSVLKTSGIDPHLNRKHREYFESYIHHGIKLERLDPLLLKFDLKRLATAMDLARDLNFNYLGLQTLYDRYFIHENELRIETPQIFWMRVAMGLCLNEGEKKTEKAIEFYHIFSQFRFVSGTPTLFNSGTCHPQLSSCYLSTIEDDLKSIFKLISDDALLSKWAGGLGNDWTNVRATGSHIKGTNGRSQGIIPFLKIANDTAIAVNQGGKRKGAMCAYLETWHYDIEEFLELRKNTGDERRRTHDMNTANWIPDLFMKRVAENGTWTLFSPNEVPDLHDLYGKAFERRYEYYEKMAEEGKIELFKKVEALQLWRKMLSMLFETGHPWITFKDPSNIRSPQSHQGTVHSSNLCTEILLNTSAQETAVCNLGSINLAAHIKDGSLDTELLAETVHTAIRMLDNVIDINFYPIPEAREANMRHRPVGLGLMGFQDALYMQNISYASQEAIEFSDISMEIISYHAILASSQLAQERGTYSSYTGSKWDQGILPIDSILFVAKERGEQYLNMDTTSRLDWNVVRDSIRKYGMRNSNTMAIAPTATIANISGITQSIEPTYKHLYVKSNLSGEFTVCNTFLVDKLKELGLWDAEMVDDLKYFDGNIAEIERIPEDIKRLFLTAFEIEPEWIIECASRRQKWIDMGQSLNLYLAEPSGKKLHNMYMLAWNKGLKTTYYLRTLSATQIEKSTTDINKRGIQPRWMKNKSASSNIQVDRSMAPPKKMVCDLSEGCESCQ